jgi:adenosine deaminase
MADGGHTGGRPNASRVTTAEYIRRLPKVQLHCHLEGTVRAATFRDLAARNRVEIGVRGTGPIENTYAFGSFNEFLRTFMTVCKALRRPEDYARMAREYAEDAAAQGVVYAEIHVAPPVWTFFHADLDIRHTVHAIRTALDEAGSESGLEVVLIYDLVRNLGPERAVAHARDAAELQDLGVIAVGLGGDEAANPPAPFLEAYEIARAAGLRAVAHAGEAAGSESVRHAVEVLGAERIGHGLRARDDDSLMDVLAKRGTTLELCPTSNRLTGAVRPGEAHPIAEFDRRGVRCVVDADDPTLFGTTLCDEYATVAQLTDFAALERFARNAIDASFASPQRKGALRATLDAFVADANVVADAR